MQRNLKLMNLGVAVLFLFGPGPAWAQDTDKATAHDSVPLHHATLDRAKTEGALRSSYLKPVAQRDKVDEPTSDVDAFRTQIKPILSGACLKCHGPKKQKAKFRVDTLDPDLVAGEDAEWWLEVMDVLSNGEMPPADADVELTETDRATVINWLSAQVLAASQAKQGEGGHSSFRRMTRYEFSYALQDLLGLSQDFAADLPPEAGSDDGFQNRSDLLQMTSLQFSTYREIAREALDAATVRGPRPKPIYYGITMEKGGPYYMEWVANHTRYYRKQKEAVPNDSDIHGRFDKAERAAKEDRFTPNRTHFLNTKTGKGWNRSFPNGFSMWEPTDQKPVVPEAQPVVLVLPHGQSHRVDLGNHLPDRGLVRLRVRASRASGEGESYPSLSLSFGYNPNNNSSHEYLISKEDRAITAGPEKPQMLEWLIALDGIQRNPFLRTGELGERPSPNEHLTLRNVHHNSEAAEQAAVRIDYIEVTAPYVTAWPPDSHRRLFPEPAPSGNEEKEAGEERKAARKILADFMPNAWRRPVSDKELDRKLALFQTVRPICDDFQEAMVEVLATVLSSPHFLYLSQSDERITQSELAARLSFFLWSSQPDEALLRAAASGGLSEPGTLARQAERMLADPRAERLTRHFTHQWLGLENLDLLAVDRKAHPEFSQDLKQSMQREPPALFQHVLTQNRSIMDFLHADYTLLNQNLAGHYGLDEVFGNHFRKVRLPADSKRGGLLTQAGLLAMNSDGKDSHPLKRSIWLLENLLHDPPSPPPPTVPEIDLTDPDILKMTLKERMEDHRNQPACASCHAKIDPWGIAFEHFDAVGSWRDEIDGKPVDATSVLYQQSELVGMPGLKRFLLENRQDQFARAMVHKLAGYALGRPLDFSDRAEVEKITASLRHEGDGLRTLILLLVESDLFRTL